VVFSGCAGMHASYFNAQLTAQQAAPSAERKTSRTFASDSAKVQTTSSNNGSSMQAPSSTSVEAPTSAAATANANSSQQTKQPGMFAGLKGGFFAASKRPAANAKPAATDANGSAANSKQTTNASQTGSAAPVQPLNASKAPNLAVIQSPETKSIVNKAD